MWDGQAKSSRYQNFATSSWFVPGTIRGQEIEASYLGILRGLSTVYRALHDPLSQFLTEREPRPDSMTPAAYQRAITARAFDVTRYLLPLAAQTNVGQVVSIRTLEKQITRLLSSQIPELRQIGEDLQDACRKPPVNLWGELSGQASGLGEPMAPTLARYAKPNVYQAEVYSDLARYAKEVLKGTGLDQPSAYGAAEPVDLIEPHDPERVAIHDLEPSLKKALEFVRQPASKEIKPEELKKYIGDYELAAIVAKVFVKGDKTLFLFVPGQPEYELVYLGNDKFSIKGLSGYKVEFENNGGKISACSFVQPNGT